MNILSFSFPYKYMRGLHNHETVKVPVVLCRSEALSLTFKRTSQIEGVQEQRGEGRESIWTRGGGS